MKKQLFIPLLLALVLITCPVYAGTQLETLGGAIYKDLNLSLNQNQSCMTCHHPSAGFADPENRISPALFPVSDGSNPTLFGGRNAPEASYSGFSPIFHFDGELFVGGLFWDGRATGRDDITATEGLGSGPTGDPLADQAKGPFGNPVEMALTEDNTGTTEEKVVGIIQDSSYAGKFEKEFGPDAFADIDEAYNNASLAIAAFERSKMLDRFKSKFDKFVEEQGGDVSNFGVEEPVEPGDFRKYIGPPEGFKSKYLSFDEADGLAIFNSDSYTQLEISPTETNGAMCYLCHLTTNHDVSLDDLNRPANGPAEGTYNPILTDFTYDNLGLPVNPRIAALAGFQDIDPGLGGQVDQLQAAYNDYTGEDYDEATLDEGKFKVSSLRNLSRSAPYGHNGVFTTIYDIVHFYNTRGVLPECGASGGTVGIHCWPAPEYGATVNEAELGNLGLTLQQEQKLVMFLETLTD